MTSPAEFLKSLTADELSQVVKDDVEYNEVDTDPNSIDRTVIGLTQNKYPELAGMVVRNIEMLLGCPAEEVPVEQLQAMMAPALITIGAICRIAEARDLPTL